MSSATYATGDSGLDFGNTYYNDHHFHYGYHILAAAYIGYMDPTWIDPNRDYVNGLVRDIANPSTDDPAFPVYRSFDWYHGHSWAHGLYPAADGKVGYFLFFSFPLACPKTCHAHPPFHQRMLTSCRIKSRAPKI